MDFRFCWFHFFPSFTSWSVVVFCVESPDIWVHWKYYVCGLLCTFGEFISFYGTPADIHFFFPYRFLRCGYFLECVCRFCRRMKNKNCSCLGRRTNSGFHTYMSRATKTNVCISKWSQKYYMTVPAPARTEKPRVRKKVRLFRPNAPRSPQTAYNILDAAAVKFTFSFLWERKRQTDNGRMVERRPNRVRQRQSEKWNWPRLKDRMKRSRRRRRMKTETTTESTKCCFVCLFTWAVHSLLFIIIIIIFLFLFVRFI